MDGAQDFLFRISNVIYLVRFLSFINLCIIILLSLYTVIFGNNEGTNLRHAFESDDKGDFVTKYEQCKSMFNTTNVSTTTFLKNYKLTKDKNTMIKVS